MEKVGHPVAIPKEVQRECCRAQQSLEALLIRKAIDGRKIKAVAVRNRKLCAQIRRDFPLGKGEAEAVALAISQKADLLAIDDKHGINACKLFRIPFAAAINILLRTREKDLLKKDEALTKLEALAKFGRYPASILQEARGRLEGS